MNRTDDDRIKGEVIAALAADPRAFQNCIRVYVNDGYVRLEGIIGTLEQKERAESISRNIFGVKEVENSLTVSADKHISDTKLMSQVRDALDSAGLANIGANVADGYAYLSGLAQNLAEKERAMDIAGSVSGIRDVVPSALRIAPGNVTGDIALADTVLEAISENMELDVSDLGVTSKNGNVQIEGEVRTEEQWKLIRSIAESVPGVHDIEMRMGVNPEIPWI